MSEPSADDSESQAAWIDHERAVGTRCFLQIVVGRIANMCWSLLMIVSHMKG